MDYKFRISANNNLRRSFLKEHLLFALEPKNIIDQQFSDQFILNLVENFAKKCEHLKSLYNSGNSMILTDSITKFHALAIDTSDQPFASVFIEKQMPNFFASLFKRETDSANIYINKSLIEEILLAIRKFSYYSTTIMANFMELNIVCGLLEHYSTFSCEIRNQILKIIANFISDYNNKEFNMNLSDLIEICGIEIFNSDDCDVEINATHLLSILSMRNDILNDVQSKESLYALFYQIFNHEKISLYSDALIGIYYLIKFSKEGCEVVLRDQNRKVEKAVYNGLNIASEKIEYHALLLSNLLYTILSGDRLIEYHSKIALKRLSVFIVDYDTDIQKAVMNIISTIIILHPQFIQSLIFNGIFVSPNGGLDWIFKRSSFELKKSAAYIVMGTILQSDKETADYLIQNELVCSATEIITSDAHFEDENLHFKLPSIIDALLMLLSSDFFKEKLLQQLIDRGIDEMISGFETSNEEINQKFADLANIFNETKK